MRFKDKKAVITGSGQGMGKATALEFAREGAHVILNDLDDKTLENTLNEIRSNGGSALAVPGDITDRTTISSIVSTAMDEYGRIDILYNNVGGEPEAGPPRPFMEQSEEYLDIMINLNLKSAVLLSKAVLEGMIKRKYGKIINTAAVAGRMPVPNMAIYSIVKAGVIALTKSLAFEMAPYNINVNCISPGPISTPGYEKIFKDIDENLALSIIPMKRVGRPEEVAKAVLYLASDDASFITGHTLDIDGGATMI